MASPLLEQLNQAQQRAVQAVDGPVLVLAGPGSGKTRVLTYRVAYLIAEKGVDPHTILAVTFTNKAAREMKERLTALVGTDSARALTIGTFHSLCARFLRRDIVFLGRESEFVIYDADDQVRLIGRVLRELNLSEKQYTPRSILSRISSAKNELISPLDFASDSTRFKQSYKEQVVARCYEIYQKLLLEYNALDFDDLLGETVRLFNEHPDILARYHSRYTYLLVDEYQDTNHAQYTLVRQLAQHKRNLFVVGDDDQSIYAWRGADVRNILSFHTDYPDAHVFKLEQNYRSTQAILDVAQAIVNQKSKQSQYQKSLWTEKGTGVTVSLWEGYDQREEARLIADEIAYLHRNDGYSLSDCAVMYRTNAQSRVLEEAFMMHNLRYRVVGGIRFYERKEIKDLLAYLRIIANPADGVSMERIMADVQGIGKRTINTVGQWASDMGISLYQALRLLDPDNEAMPHTSESPMPRPPKLSNAIRQGLLGFLHRIEDFMRASMQLDLTALLDMLLDRLHFHEALIQEYGQEEADERWRNVLELYSVANEYAWLPRESQLATFLEEVALVADTDRQDEDEDAVTCITLHQAKGLEYPVVFLIGLEEGLLPHSRSIDTREAIDEERRLFYVGVTRAKDRLYMLYAFRRMMYGRFEHTEVSRFLEHIPSYLINRTLRKKTTSAPQSSMFTERSTLRDPHAPIVRVKHEQPSTEEPQQPQQQPSEIHQPAPTPTSPAPPTPMPVQSPANRGTTTNKQRSSTRKKGDTKAGKLRFLPGQRVRHNVYGEGVVMNSKLLPLGDEEVTVSFGERGEKRLQADFSRLEHAE